MQGVTQSGHSPELVIFDCDGVLVDSEGPTNALLSADLTAHGLPVSVQDCQDQFVGGTINGVFEAARQLGASLPDDWVPKFYEKVYTRFAQGIPLIDGVLEVIEALEARGSAIWIASNGPMQKMSLSLGPSGLWRRFEGRILSREHFAAKPAPDMVLHALKQSGVSADRAVMIDDSSTGCMAAQNAGVRCLGYAEHGQDDQLRAVGAEPVRNMAAVAQALGL